MTKKPSKTTFLPKKFFVTSGAATSNISLLNAFDAALAKANISQCNLVAVSSILPSDAEQVPISKITPGAIVFTVMARANGRRGDTIGAGIGWSFGVRPDGIKYGLVAEAHGSGDREIIEKELRRKLHEMARIRELTLNKIETKIECIKTIEEGFGSVVVALVYLP